MVNALEAQPGGGRLEIRTTLSRMQELGGPSVFLHFKDEGPGVPAELQDRLFEPFFTTKPGGAGIGLAMAKQSVEENGGELVLAPSLSRNEGAEFVVILPLASSVARTDPQEPFRGHRRRTVKPHFLLTPGGLKTVLPVPLPDGEEMN